MTSAPQLASVFMESELFDQRKNPTNRGTRIKDDKIKLKC